MTRPVCLSIAGSDPSGGAGIQADLKTFSALGAYGAAAIAGLTVQNTQGVRAARALEPSFVVAQIEAVIDDLPVAATKIGMLTDAATASAVADLIASRRDAFGLIVLDPVMVATSGDHLLSDDGIAVVRDRLVPLADIVTPNVPEAGVLLGEPPASVPLDLVRHARALVDAGARAALVKGGHLTDATLTDVFAGRDAAGADVTTVELTSERIETRNTHGTGCTLSSAIAARAAVSGATAASGIGIDRVAEARDYLVSAIRAASDWRLSRTPSSGHGPVDHLVTL